MKLLLPQPPFYINVDVSINIIEDSTDVLFGTGANNFEMWTFRHIFRATALWGSIISANNGTFSRIALYRERHYIEDDTILKTALARGRRYLEEIIISRKALYRKSHCIKDDTIACASCNQKHIKIRFGNVHEVRRIKREFLTTVIYLRHSHLGDSRKIWRFSRKYDFLANDKYKLP